MTRGLLWLLVAAGVPFATFASDPEQGRVFYEQYCIACHDTSGEGMTPDIPDFRRGIMMSDRALQDRIENGGMGCPPFAGLLRSQEILDVVSHLRTLH